MKVGISSYGVYIPKYRIKSDEYVKVWGYFAAARVKEKAVARFDEDSLTMAVEASINALENAGLQPESLDALYFATTTPPYEEKLLSASLASSLGCRKDIALADYTNSTRDGVTALLSCMDFVRSGRGKWALAVASDNPISTPESDLEHGLGASATAFLVGSGDVIAEFEDACQVGWESWGGRFRRYGKKHTVVLGITPLERVEYTGLLSYVIKRLMEKRNLKIKDVKYLVLHQIDGRMPYRIAASLGFNDEQIRDSMLVSLVGDTGVCSSLIGFVNVLDKAEPGDRILVASYGSGAGADAFTLIVSGNKSGKSFPSISDYLESREYVDYATYLRWRRILLTET